MGIGPLELQGSISRVQDFAILKQNDDNKSAIVQSSIIGTVQKEVEEKTVQVRRGDDVSNNQRRFDAKEKGSNEYYGDGGKKNKNGQEADGSVNLKGRSKVKEVIPSIDIRI